MAATRSNVVSFNRLAKEPPTNLVLSHLMSAADHAAINCDIAVLSLIVDMIYAISDMKSEPQAAA
jgi:hypothetical protein